MSVWDLVLVELQYVVGFAPATEEAALDDFNHEGRGFLLTHVGVEPLFQEFDRLSSEAWQPRVEHQRHQ